MKHQTGTNMSSDMFGSTLQELRTVNCSVCGEFRFNDDQIPSDLAILKESSRPRWLVSGALRMQAMEKTGELPRMPPGHKYKLSDFKRAYAYLTTELIAEATSDPPFPTPAAQAERLIRFIGSNLDGLGHSIRKDPKTWAAIAGANSVKSIHMLATTLGDSGLLVVGGGHEGLPLGLTFEGWKRFHDNERTGSDSSRAFMALPFKDEEAMKALRGPFKAACKEEGFELQEVREEQGAGLIDDHIRFGIMRSRFLIADLSSRNPNVMWEAGYAHGLGKPVVYTCKESKRKTEPGLPFDVAHHNVVFWSPDNHVQAQARLRETIAVTLAEIGRLQATGRPI